MINLIFFLIAFFFYSCGAKKQKIASQRNLLAIEKIDSINKWYIIYGKQDDKIFKIISKKNNLSPQKCIKLQVEGKYKFSLFSKRSNPPLINGVPIRSQNYLDVKCYSFDESTEICIEPENKIYDLFFSKELQGLCY